MDYGLQTIHAAAAEVKASRLTPIDLLESCLDRIDKLESDIRAWVFVDRARARADAERLTEELQHGQYRSLLHGIPLGIKDIFDVFDWPTACGSELWANSIARRDCTVVERLRQAGAVLLGKTVTTQYASFDPPVTRNPYDYSRTPGGSSSGSAAAVATSMCLGAMGSQTGGSITRPAAYCGVAGCKPTYARVSVDGVMPLAHSMDHPGPIASCVRDLAILLQIIAGPDPRDPSCDPRPPADYLARLEQPLSPPRLARLHGLFSERAEPSVRELMDRVAAEYRERGAEVIDVALPASFFEAVPRHRIVMAVEGAMYHETRLRRHPEDYGPRITSLLEEGLSCSATEYARCKEHQRLLSREILGCFEGFDALLTPATPGPPPDAGTTGDPMFNSPWSYTGLPTVSFPAGRSPEGLPLCVQLVGCPWSEAELFAAALWCEGASNG